MVQILSSECHFSIYALTKTIGFEPALLLVDHKISPAKTPFASLIRWVAVVYTYDSAGGMPNNTDLY